MAIDPAQTASDASDAREGDVLFQQFNAVLDTIDYGVLFMGPDLRSKIINRAFREMWGISDEFIREARPAMADLINYNRHNHLYDVAESEFDAYVARRVEAVQSGRSAQGEMRRLDGRIIHHQIQALPDGGRLLTYFDITQLKRNEEAARQAKEAAEVTASNLALAQGRFSAVLEKIDYGVLFMGPDLRSRIINRAFREMWGISDEFIRDTRPTMADLINYNRHNHFYDVPDDEFDAYVMRRVEVVRSGKSYQGEMRRLDGRIIHHQIQALPDGGRLLTYFDISELKRSEEAAREAKNAAEVALSELRFAQDRLIQTEKLASLGQLTAGIAHEIKNPLNFVNNFSAVSIELIDELQEILTNASLSEDIKADVGELTGMLKSNLGKVQQHGSRADSIVKNMLMHSRENSGERRSADINAIVDDSLNLAYYGVRSERTDLQVTLHRSFDPAAGEIDGFPQDITRAILNLISNSLYATQKRNAEGGQQNYEPRVAASTRNLGDRVEISIRDNGGGIPAEIRDKIFNPFFTTKPPGEGTGLGLSLTHDIVVKQHAGQIEFDTRPGEFTEFRVILPRALAR